MIQTLANTLIFQLCHPSCWPRPQCRRCRRTRRPGVQFNRHLEYWEHNWAMFGLNFSTRALQVDISQNSKYGLGLILRQILGQRKKNCLLNCTPGGTMFTVSSARLIKCRAVQALLDFVTTQEKDQTVTK